MNMFSLRTIIDDILLMIRNNNISESEDLSRMQIAAWVLAYKASIIKARKDQEKAEGKSTEDDSSLTILKQTVGPLELVYEDSLDNTTLFRRRTKEKLPNLLDNDEINIISVQDQNGCVIQFMNELRKHFQHYRKYTKHELSYWYENGYIYVHGAQDWGQLKNIWVNGFFSSDDEIAAEDADEDSIVIPGWMIPDIKKMILQNELAFMLQRISDDDNNSTLDGIKPQPDRQGASINEK